MTENNYNNLIDAMCELVNLAYDATTSKEEYKRLDNAGVDIIACLGKLQQFESIGTVEEFKTLKEKNVAKKPIIQGLGQRYCTVCKCGGADHFYCTRCGQKLG